MLFFLFLPFIPRLVSQGCQDANTVPIQASLKTFTDNVIHLVIENCLVSDLPDIFSTKIVTQMSDDILRSVAEESGKVKEERIELEGDIEKLTLGLQECRRSRPRDFSGTCHINHSGSCFDCHQ